MDDLVDESVAPRRFALALIGLFAGLALLVASIGIYGVISYSVTERTQEFGLRMALGAMRGDVLQMVLWRGLRMVAVGIAAGALGALAVTRVLSGYLFGVTGHDPATFAAVAGISIAVAVAACAIPALKATRVDPMVALRYE
jgi:putative ABC transport system permease protein